MVRRQVGPGDCPSYTRWRPQEENSQNGGRFREWDLRYSDWSREDACGVHSVRQEALAVFYAGEEDTNKSKLKEAGGKQAPITTFRFPSGPSQSLWSTYDHRAYFVPHKHTSLFIISSIWIKQTKV